MVSSSTPWRLGVEKTYAAGAGVADFWVLWLMERRARSWTRGFASTMLGGASDDRDREGALDITARRIGGRATGIGMQKRVERSKVGLKLTRAASAEKADTRQSRSALP